MNYPKLDPFSFATVVSEMAVSRMNLTQFNPSPGVKLGTGFIENRTIERIYCGNAKYSQESTSAIIQHLQSNPQLRELRLWYCSFDDGQKQGLRRVLQAMTSPGCTVRVLVVNNPNFDQGGRYCLDVLSEVLPKLYFLDELEIEYDDKGIAEDTQTKLAEAMKNNYNICRCKLTTFPFNNFPKVDELRASLEMYAERNRKIQAHLDDISLFHKNFPTGLVPRALELMARSGDRGHAILLKQLQSGPLVKTLIEYYKTKFEHMD